VRTPFSSSLLSTQETHFEHSIVYRNDNHFITFYHPAFQAPWGRQRHVTETSRITQSSRNFADLRISNFFERPGTAGVTIIAIDFEYLSPATYSGFTITEIGIFTLSIDDRQQWVSTQRNIVHSRRLITPNKATHLNLTISIGESERILRRDIPLFLKLPPNTHLPLVNLAKMCL
jgi:hypothetical protein